MADVRISRFGGLNALLPLREIANNEAAPGSVNFLYEKGRIAFPPGFAKMNSAGLPLNSGDPVLAIGFYIEPDRTEHVLAATTQKIYRRNNVTASWTDITKSGLTHLSSYRYPISFASVVHDTALDSYTNHLLFCDGGLTPIQRWQGQYETDFEELEGGNGYHDGSGTIPTKHYALQVISFYNHVFLLSPKEYNGSDVLINYPSRLRWCQAGGLGVNTEWDHTNIGAGFRDLFDTEDRNVWAKRLGRQLIIYQEHSIWSCTPLPSSADAVTLNPEIDDLGLLGPYLVVSDGNVHYFLGNDYNLYRYSGGTYKEKIVNNIGDTLREHIGHVHRTRCWMEFDQDNKRVWIYVIRPGEYFIDRAYGIDVVTGAWMCRDYSYGAKGITCVAVVGAEDYWIGPTYRELLADGTTYAESISSALTYSDFLTQVLAKGQVAIGDRSGNVYQVDDDLTTEDGDVIQAYHYTKVFDGGRPRENKTWTAVTIVAKSKNNAVLNLYYRTDNFETEGTGWSQHSYEPVLSSTPEEYTFWLDVNSKAIQFGLTNYASPFQDIEISSIVVHEPIMEGVV